MKDGLIVLVTVGNREKGREIARALVEARLAACVNMIGEIRSLYRWKGEVVEDGESLLLIKTRAALFDQVKEKVLALHDYELPEIVGLALEKGHAAYLEWIFQETSKED